MFSPRLLVPCFALSLAMLCAPARGAKLIDVRTVDEEIVMVYWHDAEVEYKDTGTGPTAFHGGCDSAGEVIHKFNPPLDTAAAVKADSYEVTSATDAQYAAATHPVAVSRKTKVSGTDRAWPDCNCTLEHTVYLKLPKKLQQGAKYTIKIAAGVNSDTASKDFTFDIFSSVSEAIHVNIIGYDPAITAMKSGDLYMWLGDGGARDYSSWLGRKVTLYNVTTRAKQDVGTVTFWKKSGGDYGNWNLTKSDVWNCDFSAFKGTGTYRLVVDGVGCSPDFVLSRSVYYEPFKTSVRGYFYMRIGEDKDIKPVPRQPRFIPGKDPAGFTVYMTTYGPFHPDWKKTGGDQWDKQDWSKYNEPGNPTNPNAWGGHSDATDWDRNPAHVSSIWDMLLPYMLSNGKISDDNCQIRESGNGIPDIIDEANYETDFWLRLRDGKGGYACGLNNPSKKDTVMYQAGASPYMAWVSAANAAMTADAFRIARKPELVKKYQAAAIEAWKTANEEGLDLSHGIGNGADARARPEVHGGRVSLQCHRRQDLRRCDGQGMYDQDADVGDRQWQGQPALGRGRVSAVRKEQRPADPLSRTGGEHEGGDHQRGDEEERRQQQQVAVAPQQQHDLWLVPEHAGGADGLRRACDLDRPGREGSAAQGAGSRSRLGPGAQPDERGADDRAGQPLPAADLHLRPE